MWSLWVGQLLLCIESSCLSCFQGVFLAHPCGRRSLSWPRAHEIGCICQLVWECLCIHLKASLLRLLPPWHRVRSVKLKGWLYYNSSGCLYKKYPKFQITSSVNANFQVWEPKAQASNCSKKFWLKIEKPLPPAVEIFCLQMAANQKRSGPKVIRKGGKIVYFRQRMNKGITTRSGVT